MESQLDRVAGTANTGQGMGNVHCWEMCIVRRCVNVSNGIICILLIWTKMSAE